MIEELSIQARYLQPFDLLIDAVGGSLSYVGKTVHMVSVGGVVVEVQAGFLVSEIVDGLLSGRSVAQSTIFFGSLSSVTVWRGCDAPVVRRGAAPAVAIGAVFAQIRAHAVGQLRDIATTLVAF